MAERSGESVRVPVDPVVAPRAVVALAGVVGSDSETGVDLSHPLRAAHGELRAEPVDVLFLNGCHVSLIVVIWYSLVFTPLSLAET